MVLFAPPPSDPTNGGMFAPAHVAGDASSDAAVDAWSAQHRYLTRPEVEQTRMPALWSSPSASVQKGATPLAPGNIVGTVDPLALQASAQGIPYDMEARRNAIAARIVENERLQAAWNAANPTGGAGATRASAGAGTTIRGR